MSKENKAAVDRLIKAFNDGNLDPYDELIAPDFVGHNPLLPEDIKGIEGMKGYLGAFLAAMPDIQHTTWTLIAEGDLVVAHMDMIGTFTSELMGIPPNGKKVETWMANIFRFSGGKVVEWWANADTLGIMQQLGVVPTGE